MASLLRAMSKASPPARDMPARRLEDRIRELCARALYTKEPEWSAVVHELQLAIQEHGLRVSNLTTAATLGGRPEIVQERRKT